MRMMAESDYRRPQVAAISCRHRRPMWRRARARQPDRSPWRDHQSALGSAGQNIWDRSNMGDTPVQKVCRRPAGVLAAIVSVLAALLVGAPKVAASPVPLPSCTDSYSLAFCVAYLARQEYRNVDGHKYEKPLGSNCNFSTKATWHAAGATQC